MQGILRRKLAGSGMCDPVSAVATVVYLLSVLLNTPVAPRVVARMKSYCAV